MRIAIDTNVLVYAEGIDDPEKGARADALIQALPAVDTVIPAQVLAELFRVLTRKALWPSSQARSAIVEWTSTFMVEPTTEAVLHATIDLATNHDVPIFDAIILNVAADAGCRLLLSEDYSHGFVWRGVTVVDPFAAEEHPLLKAALAR